MATVTLEENMATQQTTIRVRQIHCEGCERRIEKAASQVDGVRQVKADHRTGEVRVVLDETRASETAIRASIERAGFEVQP
jgi:copper chaperone CopZ